MPKKIVRVDAVIRQRLPVGGDVEIAPLVAADVLKRVEMGNEVYGQPLLAHDGRDTLVDAYQEALDLCVYLKKMLVERGAQAAEPAPQEEGGVEGSPEGGCG